jgi:hypothetical protein
MHRTFSKLAIVGAAFVVLIGLTVLITGKPATGSSTGLVDDWTHHHLIFSNPGTFTEALAQGRFKQWYRTINDPRYIMQQMKRNHVSTGSTANTQDFATLSARLAMPLTAHRLPVRKAPPRKPRAPHRDWAFSLGTGGVAQNMYPAKFTFNVNATPNCTSDFVVYGLNVGGTTGGQANLVALNNLYSNTGGTGFCSGTAPTVYWAYNATNHSGTVTTSPVLSNDSTGSKVIYVESKSGGPSYLHVLVWVSGQGTVGDSVAPTNSETNVGSCPASASCLVSTELQTTTGTSITSSSVTNSSPWYDYASDTVYVGDDAGNLFKVTPVLGSGTPAVTGLSVASGTKLTGPVYDSSSGNIFVGSTNGALYAVTASTMVVASTTPLQVGDTTCAAGANGSDNSLIDPPIVDGTNGWVYEWATTGSNGTNTVVVQASTTLPSGAFTGTTVVDVGEGDPGCTNKNYGGSLAIGFPTHSPEFDNAYYTGNLSSGHMWVCGRPSNSGSSPGESNAAFWAVATSGTNGALVQPSGYVFANGFDSNGAQCSPFTEIFQPNISGGTDYIFFGEGDNNSGDPTNFATLYGITVSGTTATYILPVASYPAYPNANGGTSGVVIDNLANTTTYPQASSIYFTTLASSTTVCGSTSAYCAIKLTQSAMQ